jgi:hypothetical protein
MMAMMANTASISTSVKARRRLKVEGRKPKVEGKHASKFT